MSSFIIKEDTGIVQ